MRCFLATLSTALATAVGMASAAVGASAGLVELGFVGRGATAIHLTIIAGAALVGLAAGAYAGYALWCKERP